MEVDWIPGILAVSLVVLALIGGFLLERSRKKKDRQAEK